MSNTKGVNNLSNLQGLTKQAYSDKSKKKKFSKLRAMLGNKDE